MKTAPLAAGARAEQLAAGRAGALHVVRNGHVVSRPEPAVAVAQEQHLPHSVGQVRLRLAVVPDSAVKEHRVTRPDLHRREQSLSFQMIILSFNFIDQFSYLHRDRVGCCRGARAQAWVGQRAGAVRLQQVMLVRPRNDLKAGGIGGRVCEKEPYLHRDAGPDAPGSGLEILVEVIILNTNSPFLMQISSFLMQNHSFFKTWLSRPES